MMNFTKFYQRPNKVDQDRAILHLLDATEVKRQCLKVQDVNKQKDLIVSVKYSQFNSIQVALLA